MGVIDLHYTWLVMNSVVGCSNSCKYCFLFNQYPEVSVYATPEESVNQLLQFPYYHRDIPLCLFPNTDIFLNEQNISYLLQTLDIIEEKQIFNDIVLITKCKIPDYVIERIKKFQEGGHHIVVYLSYSGLDQEIEPGIHREDIMENFKQLSKENIPVIHYYRPFLPQNSKLEQIQKLLKSVEEYSSASVVTGLMVDSKRVDCYDFWPELQEIESEDIAHCSSVWPGEAWNFFDTQKESLQNIYFLNSCAIRSVFHVPCESYYGSFECTHSNICDEVQRKRCHEAFVNRNYDAIFKNLESILEQLGFSSYRYERCPDGSIELIGENISSQLLVYLTYVLGVKVFSKNGMGLNGIYHSSLNDAKPYILRREK